MSEPITQAMYSVPIVRRENHTESLIPEEYRDRTHANKNNYVRCGLFPGENIVRVTWGGPEQANLYYQRPDGGGVTTVGYVPSGSGGGVPI